MSHLLEDVGWFFSSPFYSVLYALLAGVPLWVGVAEWFRGPRARQGSRTVPGILNIFCVRTVFELFSGGQLCCPVYLHECILMFEPAITCSFGHL